MQGAKPRFCSCDKNSICALGIKYCCVHQQSAERGPQVGCAEALSADISRKLQQTGQLITANQTALVEAKLTLT